MHGRGFLYDRKYAENRHWQAIPSDAEIGRLKPYLAGDSDLDRTVNTNDLRNQSEIISRIGS